PSPCPPSVHGSSTGTPTVSREEQPSLLTPAAPLSWSPGAPSPRPPSGSSLGTPPVKRRRDQPSQAEVALGSHEVPDEVVKRLDVVLKSYREETGHLGSDKYSASLARHDGSWHSFANGIHRVLAGFSRQCVEDLRNIGKPIHPLRQQVGEKKIAPGLLRTYVSNTKRFIAWVRGEADLLQELSITSEAHLQIEAKLSTTAANLAKEQVSVKVKTNAAGVAEDEVDDGHFAAYPNSDHVEGVLRALVEAGETGEKIAGQQATRYRNAL
ncbi:unnamed protein product, partial [Owenia fusiformis]